MFFFRSHAKEGIFRGDVKPHPKQGACAYASRVIPGEFLAMIMWQERPTSRH
jgi:hypothetical protein